ncbi:MAG TPA: hypothetical protein VGJ81_06545 [Thermoanaerobaculia bacterium]
MGAILSLLALIFGFGGLVFLGIGLFGDPADRKDWVLWTAIPAIFLVAFWGVSTGWRLITGCARRGGGLLSPAALVLFGVGCVAASIAGVVISRRIWLGWVRLLPIALLCFGLASARWHAEKKAKARELRRSPFRGLLR